MAKIRLDDYEREFYLKPHRAFKQCKKPDPLMFTHRLVCKNDWDCHGSLGLVSDV